MVELKCRRRNGAGVLQKLRGEYILHHWTGRLCRLWSACCRCIWSSNKAHKDHEHMRKCRDNSYIHASKLCDQILCHTRNKSCKSLQIYIWKMMKSHAKIISFGHVWTRIGRASWSFLPPHPKQEHRWVPSLLARCCICGATGVCFHGAQLVERLVGATFGLEAKRLQTCRIQILQYSNKIQKRCSSHAEQMKAAQIACAGSANSRLITKSGHDH